MNKAKKFNLIIFLLILTGFISKAQESPRVFSFKLGDEFQRETLINSNSSLQRGDQTLEIASVSSTTKTYTVKSTSSSSTNFSVKYNKMDNLIDALGKQLFFSSEQKIDSTSSIQKALSYMINKPVDVTVDKYGVVTSSNLYKSEFATDTLVAFAGIVPEIFEKGVLLSLFADYTLRNSVSKGFTWTDSVSINKQTLKTKYWIEDINEKFTIVKFSSKITTQLVNSNSNGTYIVDNDTGLIIEKLVYSLSTGYQVSTGGVIYAVARSSSISERIKKVSK